MIRSDIRSAMAEQLIPHNGSHPVVQPVTRKPWHFVALGALAASLVLGAFLAGHGYHTCNSMAQEQSQARQIIASGQEAIAIGFLENALTQTVQPCPPAKLALATLWYRASMSSMLATPSSPESVSRHAATKWLSIERKADAFGVPKADREPATQIAQRAFAAGLWDLADAASKEGWKQGATGVDSIAFRYSLLRNEGHALGFSSHPDLNQAALLLCTADAIAKAHGLPNGEALIDLHQLGYSDCTTTPIDTSDPALSQMANGETQS